MPYYRTFSFCAGVFERNTKNLYAEKFHTMDVAVAKAGATTPAHNFDSGLIRAILVATITFITKPIPVKI